MNRPKYSPVESKLLEAELRHLKSPDFHKLTMQNWGQLAEQQIPIIEAEADWCLQCLETYVKGKLDKVEAAEYNRTLILALMRLTLCVHQLMMLVRYDQWNGYEIADFAELSDHAAEDAAIRLADLITKNDLPF